QSNTSKMMHAVGEIFKPDEPPLERTKEKCGFFCCVLFTFKLFVRLICLVAGAAQCAMGGYTFYNIANTKTKTIENYIQLSVIGFFAVVTGLAILFAEIRNRWTKKTLRVMIFIANGLARGFVYILIGCIDIPIPFKFWKVTAMHVGVGIIGCGVLSIITFLVSWRRKRQRKNKDIATAQDKTKKTQLYDLFEREDSLKEQITKDGNEKDLEMQPVQE
ncbi:hypothetical protein SAMD00019534_030720, partial [Acytostelium subglobosum LB1]|uniref:hypothetical protein n=1 Tax=Acytostelium subglobosum LB1 TaxID=1410327 RepID=UPI00064514EC